MRRKQFVKTMYRITGLIWLLLISQGMSQNPVKKVVLQINTVNKAEIHFVFVLNRPIDRPATMPKIDSVNFTVNRLDNDHPLTTRSSRIGLRPDKIDFIISLNDSLGAEIIEALLDKSAPVYLKTSAPIPLMFADPPETISLPPELIKELSLQATGLTSRQKDLLDAAAAGDFSLKNHMDFSRRISEKDSTQTEYVAHFDIVKPIPLPVPLFFKFKGTISTQKHNPLNYSEATIAMKIPGMTLLTAELGRTGTQDFSTNALRFNLGVETLIPNFINLSENSARLRLKPYIKAGLAFQKFYQKANPFNSSEMNLLAFLEMYYYIPVKEKYALIWNMDATWSDKFVNNEKYRINYSITLGYDAPLKDLKLIFKLESGKNEITLGDDTRLLMGALVDLIP